ncbi:hypothetical protein ACFQX7_15410 [Luedemannella flava]
MPLRVMVGYRPELIASSLGLRAVPESRAVLVDARDLDPPEASTCAPPPSPSPQWNRWRRPRCRTDRCCCTSTAT